jgi:predicted DNA-binding protein (MmcQ/YjbR family)
MPKQRAFSPTLAAMRKRALAYPETVEDHPWGECAFKVKGKVFLFAYLHVEEGWLNLTMKLPISGPIALTMPFASRTGYGLGKSGWVTSRFNAGDDVPLDMLIEWLDESYRAVAPKRVVALMDDAEESPPAKRGRKKSV